MCHLIIKVRNRFFTDLSVIHFVLDTWCFLDPCMHACPHGCASQVSAVSAGPVRTVVSQLPPRWATPSQSLRPHAPIMAPIRARKS